jgi:hypothetical protein
MQPCKTPIASYAANVVEHWVKTKSRFQADTLSDIFMTKAACFVSLHTIDGGLRGCIGTIEPRCSDLAEEIVENAIAAAERDSRFEPVVELELENIYVTVDVLSEPQLTTPDELNPAKFGLIISDGHFRRGVLLPALEGVKTSSEQIRIVKRKAGLTNIENNLLKFYRFTSTRYD